ncbi:MAG TPA: ATP-dependent zinc metalloprotease FtsH [Chloroflexota bacterium]|nr:ATP-dependent zinc metalloprotease FtsH [Chloroflexota bacterium]
MNDNGRGRSIRDVLLWALIIAVPLGWLILTLPEVLPKNDPTIPISQVAADVERGDVRALTVQGDSVEVLYTDGQTAESQKESGQSIVNELKNQGVTTEKLSTVTIEVVPQSFWSSIGIWIWLLPIAFIVGAILLMSRQAPVQGNTDQTLSFLKSRARKISADRPKVRFDDVAGVDEAKQELHEVVDFLRSPTRFTAVGARIPKGVLLIGPPGTGKTLLARAVAGEAGVPFFSISGSEFVELFVGVGASRVRDLFDQAKRNAPCIIFVDEIDAVGRQRGFGIGGGHDEREQTLNQILVEMDGFDKQTNVVVIAATNRPDVLDTALLSPGRFDRRVVLDAPDVGGRRSIIKIHSRNKPLAPDVDLDRLASETAGFCGADLENLMNEGAILAARSGRQVITDADLEEAVDRVLAGPQRRSRLIGPREKLITAYHEAGHAVSAHWLASVDKVHKITVVPRGISGGHTRLLNLSDRQLWSRSQLMDNLTFILGGMAAEALIFGETTTGPGSDLEHATDIARRMVCSYGMSENLGPMVLGHFEGYGVHAKEVGDRVISDTTATMIDREVRRLVTNALNHARQLLEEHRETLDRIAQTLIQQETLQGELLQRMLNGEEIGDVGGGRRTTDSPPSAPRVFPNRPGAAA